MTGRSTTRRASNIAASAITSVAATGTGVLVAAVAGQGAAVTVTIMVVTVVALCAAAGILAPLIGERPPELLSPRRPPRRHLSLVDDDRS